MGEGGAAARARAAAGWAWIESVAVAGTVAALGVQFYYCTGCAKKGVVL